VPALLATALAVILLVPWPLAWFDADGASLGLVVRDPLDLGAVLRFATGPAGAGLAPWGLLVAGALPLVVATGPRLVWATRAWLLVAVSYTLAWLPGRLDASLARPEPEGVLVGAALGLALAAGLGVAAFADDLRRFLFGWRQVAAVAAAFGLLLPIVGTVGDSFGGRWRLPPRDWPEALGWMDEEVRKGDFRVLWLGDPDVLPVGPRTTDTASYGLSRNGAGDVRTSFVAPAGDGEPVLDDALTLLAESQTARFGHLVAPMGVRYVAVVRRAAPDGGVTRPYDRATQVALAEQLDLAIVQAEPDMVLYENQAWAPTRAVVPAATNVEAPDGDAIESSLRAELSAASPVRGDHSESRVRDPGTLLFGDAYDSRWRARQEGEPLAHDRAFGWSNAYTGAERGVVDLSFDGGITRTLWLVLQAALWLAAAAAFVVWRRDERRGSSR
jgi:hypothetical protein